MFNILFIGYGADDDESNKITGFAETNECTVNVYTNYSVGDYKVGDTIQMPHPHPNNFTIVNAYLGFGDAVTEVHIGYKAILQLTGEPEDIELLKSRLESIGNKWFASDVVFGCFVINKCTC